MELVSGGGGKQARFRHVLPTGETVEIVVERDKAGRPGITALHGSPDSPLTAQTLRRLPLATLLDQALLALAELAGREGPQDRREWPPHIAMEIARLRAEPGRGGRDHYRLMARMAGSDPSPPGAVVRPGRPGHGDLYYAGWAEAYVNAIASGIRSPTRFLAETRAPRRSNRYALARTTLVEARKRGLLTSAGPGKAGGELTPKAIELLEADHVRQA